jgi:hypothetical protein
MTHLRHGRQGAIALDIRLLVSHCGGATSVNNFVWVGAGIGRGSYFLVSLSENSETS